MNLMKLYPYYIAGLIIGLLILWVLFSIKDTVEKTYPMVDINSICNDN